MYVANLRKPETECKYDDGLLGEAQQETGDHVDGNAEEKKLGDDVEGSHYLPANKLRRQVRDTSCTLSGR